MKVVKVKINWFFEKRRIPPVIEEKERKKYRSYSPIIIIKGQYLGDWQNQPLWSSIIFNDEISGKESIAKLTYLADEAPYELLQVGAEFELFEGPNKVASGVILEELNISPYDI